MKVLYINGPAWLEKLMDELSKYGYQRVNENPDIILGMTHSLTSESREAYERYPIVLKVQYNWDLYEWQNYDGYRWLLDKSDDIWYPSSAVQKRTQEFYGMEKGRIIKTFIPVEHLKDAEIKDERFVLSPIRHYLKDKYFGWFEKACEELKIPYDHPDHSYSDEEFKRKIASCSFIVSAYYEASTGGLGIIEGTYLGKSVLLTDSPYMGAKDYLGDRAWYFTDYESLKEKIKLLWDNTPKLNLKECQDWVLESYSVARMAKEVNDALQRVRN